MRETTRRKANMAIWQWFSTDGVSPTVPISVRETASVEFVRVLRKPRRNDGNGRFTYDSISKQDSHRCDCSRIYGAGYLDASSTRYSCFMSTRYSLDTPDVNQMYPSKRSPSTSISDCLCSIYSCTEASSALQGPTKSRAGECSIGYVHKRAIGLFISHYSLLNRILGSISERINTM